MEKVIIERNPNGDTRTASPNVTYEQFQKANDKHIEEVGTTMTLLGLKLIEQGKKHDWTKKEKEELFYNNFLDTLNNGVDFPTNDWYQYHIDKEKHHPISNCHHDINLLDIIEMVVDCVCAGKARSGSIRKIEADDDILQLALENTVKLVNDTTIVIDK